MLSTNLLKEYFAGCWLCVLDYKDA